MGCPAPGEPGSSVRDPMRFVLLLPLLLGTLVLAPAPAFAQTDFYNLDKERPLRVEDAFATKRWAFEVQASPFTLSQDRDGVLRYQPAVELKHGILPGVETSVGVHLDRTRDGTETRTRLGEVELSALANLWVEGAALPALGVRVTGHLPTESDHDASVEVKGILTRTLTGPVRAHLNGAVVLGDDASEDWWTGAALDWVLPFHHTLLLVEGWVSEPAGGGDRTVHSTAGVRYQLSPTFVLDAGVGRGWSGDLRQDWTLTLGVTHEFGVRSLIPGVGR
jgi:hypothetical protein